MDANDIIIRDVRHLHIGEGSVLVRLSGAEICDLLDQVPNTYVIDRLLTALELIADKRFVASYRKALLP